MQCSAKNQLSSALNPLFVTLCATSNADWKISQGWTRLMMKHFGTAREMSFIDTCGVLQ